MKFDPSYHIRGCYPVRELDAINDADERTEPRYAVQIPMGFETLDFAVYGYGLSESNAIEAVREFHFPDAPDTDTDCWYSQKINNGKLRLSILPVTDAGTGFKF